MEERSIETEVQCCICKHGMPHADCFFVDQIGGGHARCIATWSEMTAAGARRVIDQQEVAAKRHSWIMGQMKGGIAEFACRQHFSAIDYGVESIGIEHVAPHLIGLKYATDRALPSFARAELSALPDFMMSRRNPFVQEVTGAAPEGALEMLLVEAKYRSSREMAVLERELYRNDGYKKLIDRGARIVFYAIVRQPLVNKKTIEGHLFLNRSWNQGWASVGDINNDPLFQPIRSNETFEEVYRRAIEPGLLSIWQAPVGEDQSESSADSVLNGP
jgi:hypothetical protein